MVLPKQLSRFVKKIDHPMKIKKTLLACLLLSLTVFFIQLVALNAAPILTKSIHNEIFGDIAIAQPMWGVQGLTLVFVDIKEFPSRDLARRVASTGVIAAVVDSLRFFKAFTAETGQCLDGQHVSEYIGALEKELPMPSISRQFVVGIAEGALIPLINAQSSGNGANLSFGFTVNLPTKLILCAPLSSQHHGQEHSLVFTPEIKGKWRSIWADKPDPKTALFIKEKLRNVDTYIAAYDTPFDILMINELNSSIGRNNRSLPPMPVIEVPAGKHSDSVTLFYSGDGGWRDLDKTVAGEMATLNYPVIGIDVLRYFWERKAPDQAAADLATTMAFYRKNWGVKTFILAGYSFGADILPVIYNRLPQQDRDSVALLALLALANHADFEIHVSGWLGQTVGEMPLAPELAKIPKHKILCIYGKEEKEGTGTGCTELLNSEAKVLELPGGHHFDKNYPKLTRLILESYRQHGIN